MTTNRALQAARDGLDLTRRMREAALRADRTPWTAVAALTRQEAELVRQVAALESDTTDDTELTPEIVREEILALPDDLLGVAEDALRERRALGYAVVEAP